MRQRAKAIRVPAEDTDLVLPTDLRHVLVEPGIQTIGASAWHVEPGIQTIGASAWQSCQQLQIVKLPSTVVCLQDGVFLFLRVSRRYVRRGCTSHLRLVKRATVQAARRREPRKAHHPQNKTTKQPKPTQKATRTKTQPTKKNTNQTTRRCSLSCSSGGTVSRRKR